MNRPKYLDFAATTPVDPEVEAVVLHYMREEFGNAGSRTHEYGTAAKKAVQHAREQVARVVAASPDEVIFTSGATESNNLALLGLREHAEKVGKKHLVCSAIEHKAVLEPLQFLAENHGFSLDLVPCDPPGRLDPQVVSSLIREDTLLVSIMQVNNETGIIQPIPEICEILKDKDIFFHVDAAQGFGKLIEPLQHPRIDLISISGHKLYAPKGVGALVSRKRNFRRPPIKPLMFGGGQERGIRPGTLAVPLIVGLGKAAELQSSRVEEWTKSCLSTRQDLLKELEISGANPVGDQSNCVPHILSVCYPGRDSEALLVEFKDKFAISNGAACTSQSYSHSHVLEAMNLPEDEISSVLRFSWSTKSN